MKHYTPRPKEPNPLVITPIEPRYVSRGSRMTQAPPPATGMTTMRFKRSRRKGVMTWRFVGTGVVRIKCVLAFNADSVESTRM